MLGGILPALVLATVVNVEGDTACPRPAQVTSHLNQLLAPPSGAPGGVGDDAGRARLSEDDGDLVVVLQDPTGEVIGTRRLPRSPACDDLASAVAVSIAVWMSDVHPSYSSTQLAPPAQRLVAADLQSRAAPPPSRAPAAWGAGLALGMGGSLDVPVVAGDLLAGAWLRLSRSRTAVRVEAEGQSRRELTLQGGRSEWRRWVLGVGLERTLAADADGAGAGWLRAFATAHVALLDLEGAGFAVNHHAHAVDPGLSAGLRVVWKRGAWASWVEGALSLWPIGHDAVADTGTNEVQRLPVLEGFLRVGAGWGAGR